MGAQYAYLKDWALVMTATRLSISISIAVRRHPILRIPELTDPLVEGRHSGPTHQASLGYTLAP